MTEGAGSREVSLLHQRREPSHAGLFRDAGKNPSKKATFRLSLVESVGLVGLRSHNSSRSLHEQVWAMLLLKISMML